MTDTCFTLPKDFDAKSYFSSFFGIVLDKDIKEERIVLRADRYHQHYLRTLPLHPSQREIYTSDEYADFELHLRPTYDFCMELLKVGAMIEVLEPQSLRHQLHGCIKDMWKIYENLPLFKKIRALRPRLPTAGRWSMLTGAAAAPVTGPGSPRPWRRSPRLRCRACAPSYGSGSAYPSYPSR